MKKELRVYAINEDELKDDIDDILLLPDDQWIDISEEQGHVWSIDGFQNSFNFDEISDQWYIRFITIKLN